MNLLHGRITSLSPAQVALGTVLLTTLLHLLVLGRFDLGVDEAHYALYGLNLDWSYFDHPPMVGWLQAVVVPFSQSEFALRLWAVLLGFASSAVLYRLTRLLFPESPWSAALSVALLNSALIYQLVTLALVPEGPLLFFALFAALMLFRALQEGRLLHWAGAGAGFGLAGLSKYTAVTLVLTALVLLVWERRWRVLRTPGPWLAALIALLLIAPVLYWNLQHDWLSFRYQLGHGAPDRHWSLWRFSRSQLLQFFTYAPAVMIFGLWAMVRGWRERHHPGVRFSLALALPLLALMGWGAGLEETLPHWTLLGWAGLLPFASWLVQRHWPMRWVRVTAWGSAIYSVLMVVLLHSLLFKPWLPFQEYRHPLGDLLGWREAALHARQLAEARGGVPIISGNWSLASRLAWYARPQRIVVADDRYDQFDLWYGSPVAGERGVLVVPDNYEGRPRVSGMARFERCQLLDVQAKVVNGVTVHRFSFYECSGYRG